MTETSVSAEPSTEMILSPTLILPMPPEPGCTPWISSAIWFWYAAFLNDSPSHGAADTDAAKKNRQIRNTVLEQNNGDGAVNDCLCCFCDIFFLPSEAFPDEVRKPYGRVQCEMRFFPGENFPAVA